MRSFVILCVVAMASAAPQGYNYQNQHGPIGGPSFLQEALQHPLVGQALLSQPQPAGHNYHHQPHHQLPLAPIITKDIYVHAAPADLDDHYTPAPAPVLPPRKHYRIVFIKAPTQTINPAAIRLAQAQTEEKTIIYVLSKKQDPLDLQLALQEVQPTVPSKPEVYFIKYKTQEEAAHAQQEIQAQFDSLGGSTHISDEGVAPVTSVVGSLDHQQTADQTSANYLPPNAGAH